MKKKMELKKGMFVSIENEKEKGKRRLFVSTENKNKKEENKRMHSNRYNSYICS